MINFVNAKINIGLNIVRRREDGYHELQTVFYPVGKFNGTPVNPSPFCDILEIVRSERDDLSFICIGQRPDCSDADNIVVRAARAIREATGFDVGLKIILDKRLPFGAGMGGGSADASFALRGINEELRLGLDDRQLAGIALKLGADCPFFIYNRPMYAGGIGEEFNDIPLDLTGKWLVVVMPYGHVSTREAFAGVTPTPSDFDLRSITELPIEEWRYYVKNDFEDSIFPLHPEWEKIKGELYAGGALYSSLTGSGAAFYGIFASRTDAEKTAYEMKNLTTVAQTYLLSL